jgi:putative membrane protein
LIASWILAALHLLGLAIGLPAVWARGRALRRPLDAEGLARVFHADTWWGVAAGVWLGSGLLRAFGSFDKGADYYLNNHLFLAKMGLFLAILALELFPMITLIRWRIQSGRGEVVDTRRAGTFARISLLQVMLVVAMVVAATGMARGHGMLPPPGLMR